MDDYIELQSGSEIEKFELLLRFRFKGKDYIALRPEAEDEETAAIFLIKTLNNGEEEFISIDDTNVAKEVFVHFVSLWEMAQDELEDEEEKDE